MTQRPYSTKDLHAQAALYVDEAAVNPLAVLSDMADQTPWCGLNTDDFNSAHSAILALIHGSAPTEGTS